MRVHLPEGGAVEIDEEFLTVAQFRKQLANTLHIEEDKVQLWVGQPSPTSTVGFLTTLVPAWYPQGKYDFDGKDVLKITSGFEYKYADDWNDSYEHKNFVVHFTNGSSMDSTAEQVAEDFVENVEYFLKHQGFVQHTTDAFSGKDNGCPFGRKFIEAVPAEDPTAWERHATGERRVPFGSSPSLGSGEFQVEGGNIMQPGAQMAQEEMDDWGAEVMGTGTVKPSSRQPQESETMAPPKPKPRPLVQPWQSNWGSPEQMDDWAAEVMGTGPMKPSSHQPWESETTAPPKPKSLPVQPWESNWSSKRQRT